MAKLPKVTLKSGKEFALSRFHPWIFSGAIAATEPGIKDGDLVQACASDGKPLAIGHFGEESIAIRVLSFTPTNIDESFWLAKIKGAIRLRQTLNLPNPQETNAYRLINAEGDGLPGLTVDIYGQCAVIQCHSSGMYQQRELFAQIIRDELGSQIKSIYCKAPPSRHATTPQDEVREVSSGEYLVGAKTDDPILENGLRFQVDWEHGQKTGFFLDQRENREAIRQFARDKRVLNTFCYTGGFSVYALAGGASKVDSVDTSKSALELVDLNIKLNDLNGAHQTIQADCLNFLREIDNRYDVIVLDPPAFIKHRKALSGGIKGYETINSLAIKQIAPGGILFTFSCSQHLSRQQFLETVQKAAQRSGRATRIIRQLHAAPCHPISLYHPEGEYLKGLVLYVE